MTVSAAFFPSSITAEEGIALPFGFEIPEEISSDLTLGQADSPIYLNGSVTVLQGVIFRLLPGAEMVMGPGSGLSVQGSFLVGGEGPITVIGSQAPQTAGSWKGISFLSGSLGRFENTGIAGANTSLSLSGTGDVVVRNSTVSLDNTSLHLDKASALTVVNSTLDYDAIELTDNGSVVRTFHYLYGKVVDHLGGPKDFIRIEIFNSEGALVLSYTVNQTGEVIPVLLEGGAFIRDGRDWRNGTYHISMTDAPFTHFVNMTYVFNGTALDAKDLRFTWPPEFSNPPSRINLYEDSVAYKYTEVLDRNRIGSVDVLSSTPSVRYNWTHSRLEFHYTDESVLKENVTITLDDGYDTRDYTILVNVTPVDDPPHVQFPSMFAYPREDVPYLMKLQVTDEDTKVENIQVTTDDPENITYDRMNTTLVFLYGDGTAEEFNVTVNITDGTSVISRKLAVDFQPVYYNPQFLLPLPDLELMEDMEASMDLGPYLFDPDRDEELFLSARLEDYDIFSFKLDGNVITVVPLADRFGKGTIQLTLMDERDLTTTAFLNVTVLPVDDRPILSNPMVVKVAEDTYWFNITYSDIDGDLPDSAEVLVGGYRYNLTTQFLLPPVYEPVIYSRKLALRSGTYNVTFRFVQGPFIVEMKKGNVSIPLVERTYQLSAYNRSVMALVRGVGEGRPPSMMEVNTTPARVGDMFDIGCAFRFDHGDISPREAVVQIWPLDFRQDIIILSLKAYYWDQGEWMEFGTGIFDSNTKVETIFLSFKPLNHTISLFARLDPDYDTDNDGVKNLLDDFPEDPTEWVDTDGDGIGNNKDTDDDGDGFSDILEMEAGTDSLSAASYPRDTDGDGELDFMDDDDDNDGMPDEWEVKWGFDQFDPSDASQDPDGDGLSNLEEFLAGSDPWVDESEPESGMGFPVWMALIGAFALVILLVVGVLLFFVSRKPQDEVEFKEMEEEWEIQGELDPDDAVECESCGEFYPYWFEECPNCREPNPYEE
ncbi:MAG: thrombospondin type 3 repeat-containing protein [Thermoplasmatota archaeon]